MFLFTRMFPRKNFVNVALIIGQISVGIVPIN